MTRLQQSRRRSFLATLESMECRQLLSAVPILMTDGGQASQPSWGQTPTPPDDLSNSISTIFAPESVITKDINGNPIDFNKDGYGDLIETGQALTLVGYSSTSSQLVPTSRGTFGKVAFGGPNGPVFSDQGLKAVDTVTVQTIGNQMAIADLNGDGYQDILTTMSTSETAGSGFHIEQWIFDPQQQTFTRASLPTTIDGWANKTGQMTLGDVTGDGVPDLVMQNFATTPVPSPKNSAQNVLPMIGFQVFAGVITAGRWSGDFAAAPISSLNLKQPSAEWGLPTGESAPYTTVAPIGTISVVNSVLSDLNGDGKLDLAIPEADGVTAFPNPGNGVFLQGDGVFTPSAGSANGLNLVAGDFNNDGKIDLASSPNYVSSWLIRDHPGPSFTVWSASAAPISVHLNTTPSGGPISFTTSAVNAFDAMSGWNGTIALADFNGDGNLDIAVASGRNQSTQYGVLAGDGTGHFGTLMLYQGYTNSADGYDDSYKRAIDYLAVSDFNKDGQFDIVTTALNIGPVGTFSPQTESQSNEAVGITGISYNKTFAAPGVDPQTVTAFVTQPLTQQLTPTGGDPTKIYLFSLNPASVPLPPGLTLTPTGQLTGTPTVSGPYQLTLDMTQPNGPRSTVHLNLNVDTARSSSVLPGIMPNAVAGLPFQQQLTATLGPATWILTNGTLPAGLTLSSGGLISGTPLATGTYGFTVLGTGSGFQTVMNYQFLVQAAAAPVVTSLVRYGYHNQPTSLVVAFSQDMNAQSASNLANYLLTTAGRDGRFGTRDDVRIALRSAVYDTVTHVVTLTPMARTIPLHRPYRLTVNGTPTQGLSSTTGIFLGGQGVASPGTNYVQVFGSEVLNPRPTPIGRVAPHPLAHPKARPVIARR